jgi:hypothetical protein
VAVKLGAKVVYHAGFPSTRWDGNESTNCGEEVCPEIAKTSAIGVSLACLIGKSYDFAVYRVVQ